MTGGDAWTQVKCAQCGAREEGTARDLTITGWALTRNRWHEQEVRCPTCLAPKRRASERERERLVGRRW